MARIIAGTLLLALLSMFAYHAIDRKDKPPEIRIEVDAVTPAADGFHVAFTAHNLGARVVRRVLVRGEVNDAGTGEKAQSTLGFIAAGSESYGGLIFHRDPRRASLRLIADADETP